MNILFHIGSLTRGGAERVIAILANYFSSIGHKCIVATSYRFDNEYSLTESVERVVLTKEGQNPIVKNVVQFYKIRKLVKERQINVVVSFMGVTNIRMLISTIGLDCRKIISVRNDPCREYSNIFLKILAKVLFNFASHVVFQTDDAKKWFPKSIQKKSSIIFNPVDESFFNIRYSGVRRNIVSVGRLTPQKNHTLLINAFASVADEIDDNLIIYGDGPLKEDLKQLVKRLGLEDRVFLPGSVPDVANNIKSARLFVLSSDYEGMPNSLMEAIAMGLPCISSDCPCGGPRMLLPPSQMFRVGDVSGLQKLLKNRSFFNASVKREIFKMDKILEEWSSIL